MHRPTITFSFSQNHNHSTKNNQPEQSIKSNNQKKQSKISQSKIRSKQNITNKHDKLSHQSIVKSITQTITTKITHTTSQSKTLSKQTRHTSKNTPRFFEYYNIANGNCFRANHKYAFYKNSTQPHKKNHGQQHYEIMYYKHEKETFHIFG